MPTKLDDSQIISQKLESLVVNVGHIKAPVDTLNSLPEQAEDGEKIYVKTLKKDFTFDAFTNKWIDYVTDNTVKEQKVIIFVIPQIENGIQKIEIKFPFAGIIKEISVSCAVPGTTDTFIQIEKCSENNYNGSIWNNLLLSSLVIPTGLKSVSLNSGFLNTNVEKNDYFRVNIIGAGDHLEGLTAQINIELQ